jgi:hypothetical protein
MRRSLRVIAVVVAACLPSLSPAVARAAPLTQPDETAMVNGPVRTLAQAGSVVWVGGSFTEADDPLGAVPLEVNSLVPIDDRTGLLDVAVHAPSVTLAGGTAIVYDSSLGPDGMLYFAGSFSAVDGFPRNNAAAIDPATGALLPFAPDVVRSRSVLATASQVFVGSSRLFSFGLDGTPTPGFSPPTMGIDPSIRGHGTSADIRDIDQVDPNTLVVACQCDRITDRHGGADVKAVVQIDAGTGDVAGWAPGGGLPNDSAAFGLSVILHDDPVSGDPTVYLAAGGSDFTAAYDASSGAQRWRTDTSGSSQAIVWYEGQLIVGGHFDWTQRPGGKTCGSNDGPNLACYHSPKLVAMDPEGGHVVVDGSGDPWNPGICCKYNGVWALLADADGGSLHVGGEFSQMGGTWSGSGQHWTLTGHAHQENYGRLSDVVSPNRLLVVTPSGSGSGSVVSVPSGISCGDVCAAYFQDGAEVTLSATANEGSEFAGWTGDCTGLGDCLLVLDQAHQVAATFTLSQSEAACGKIVFVSDRFGNNDIFTTNEDGSDLTQVTTNPASDASPAWSPDCSEIAFTSTRTGRSHIYVISAQGAGVRALTSGLWDDQQPSWSSTGLLAFASNRSGNLDIYVMTPDGANVRVITTELHADKQPTWGSGGSRIAFASNRTGISQIYSIGVNSVGLRTLTSGAFPSSQPAWSRGGAKIAFVSTSSGSPQIWIMAQDGTEQTMLTDDPGPAGHPSWSRWGGRLAYAAGSATGPSEIRIVAIDGTGNRPIGDDTLGGSSPQWS